MPKVQQKIGIIGMGIMGRNLALNIANKGYCVSIYNRSKKKTDQVIADNPNMNLIPYYFIKDFVFSLDKPRIIFLMITAGIYVDHIIQILSSYLESGDIIIDGGNSFYKDTMYRNVELSKKKINFIGVGISGGAEGALTGPSLMPGGTRDAYEIVAPVFERIAARFDNEVCVAYIGPNGSGHYVKMIHNGIEYGDMQLIAEIYSVLKNVFYLSYEQLGEVFKEWNQGELNSYLIEITSHIFMKKDDKNCYLLDNVLDIAKSKGTGVWTSKSAFDLEVPLNMINESVFMRCLSILKDQRVKAAKILMGPTKKQYSHDNKCLFIEKVRQALYFGKIILYAQGFYQLKIASDKYDWNLNYEQIAKIFRAGCIIRTKFLQRIVQIYSKNPEITNLLLDPYCVKVANNYQQMLRDVVICGIQNGISMPALSAAVAYYDGYRSDMLPSNLIQAQRDCFGAHTYMRIDMSGEFHTEWLGKK